MFPFQTAWKPNHPVRHIILLLYFAVYYAQFFAQIFEGKNKDVHYTWVVLIQYLFKCF